MFSGLESTQNFEIDKCNKTVMLNHDMCRLCRGFEQVDAKLI